MRIIWGRIREDIRRYYRGVLPAVVYVGAAGILDIPVCPMVLLTGLPCPGCGMTRAALLFLQGRLQEAWRMHPFFYVLLAMAAVVFVFRYVLGRAAGMKWIVPVVLVSSIAFYVYRMAREFPGQEPMTYFPRNGLRLFRPMVAHFWGI